MLKTVCVLANKINAKVSNLDQGVSTQYSFYPPPTISPNPSYTHLYFHSKPAPADAPYQTQRNSPAQTNLHGERSGEGGTPRVLPRCWRSSLAFIVWILFEIHSNFVQYRPQKKKPYTGFFFLRASKQTTLLA